MVITRKMIHVSLELSHVINEYIILEHVMSILLEGSVYYLGILHLITSLSISFGVLIKTIFPFFYTVR